MEALHFKGTGSEYFKIWIVNILLTIITLGFYYPWAKVRNNRYFYANTTLHNKNFEYHATGKQLFFGYLITVIVVLAYMGISTISPIGSSILFLFLLLSLPWLIWKSLSFKMQMTTYSNVRFGFKGSLIDSYKNFFLYPFIMILGYVGISVSLTMLVPMLNSPELLAVVGVIFTIGMISFIIYALSFVKKKNAEYIIGGTRYGQGVFNADIETKSIMMIFFKTIFVAIFSILFALVVSGIIIYLTIGVENITESISNFQNNSSLRLNESPATLFFILGIIYIGLIFASIFTIAYISTQQREYIYKSCNLDNKIYFEYRLTTLPFAKMIFTNMLLLIITFGLAYPWTKVRIAKLVLEHTSVKSEGDWNEYITQKESEVFSLGEQIGDAFDIDMNINVGI